MLYNAASCDLTGEKGFQKEANREEIKRVEGEKKQWEEKTELYNAI